MKKVSLVVLAIAFAACASSKKPMAVSMLNPSGAQTARGTVHLQDLGTEGIEVKIDLVGVPPGVHAFHVHEKGDCGNNGQNAGGHFNPSGMIHGAPDSVSHHAGDFGNVTAEANGEVHTSFTTHSISLTDGASNNAVGKAVVLHASPDDMITQPTGNAGARISCGVIELMAGNMHHM
jgi:Cu-Zn family superoxide dismutase